MVGLGVSEFAVIGVIAFLSGVIPMWLICTKAGFSGWWSLAMLVPGGSVILLYFLGFSKWPIDSAHKKLTS